MKKFYFLSILLLISIAVWSQKAWNVASGNWNDGANWTPFGVPAANSIITFNAGGAATISNVPTIQLNRITVTEGSEIILQSTGSNAITLNNASGIDLTIQNNASLTIGPSLNLSLANSSSAIITGTFVVNGSTFTTGGGSSVTTVTGTLNNSGTVNSSQNGSLAFDSAGTYIHSQNGGVVPEADWHVNSNCIIEGVINTMPTGFDQELGNFEWNSTGQIPFTPPAVPSFGGNLKDIEGDLIIKSTGTGAIYLANDVNKYSTVVKGDYIQTGGTFVITQFAGEGSLTIEGNFTMSGGVLARNSPILLGNLSTIYFDGNNDQTFTKTGGTISGPLDFVISNGATVNFGASILDGSTGKFTLNSGGKMITTHPAGLNSAGALGTIQTTTRDFKEDADYEFRGAVTGIFNTGASINTTASKVRNLIINNPSGSVTLSKPVTIANNTGTVEKLYLQNGALITTAVNILTLEDNVQATGTTGKHQYNLNSFVEGPLKKIGNDDFIFPVGKVGFGLHKIGISDPIGGSLATTVFTAQFFRGDPHTLSNTLGAGLEKLSACEYWTLDRSAGSTNQVQVMLSWENNSSCGGSQYVTLPASLGVARLDATGTWLNAGNTNTSGTAPFATGTVTSNTINAFSPFALASTSAANPLPVVFGDVKAYENNNGVQIEWSNLTEKDVAEYTIERSANGSDFNGIGSQLPTSNQNDKASYSAFDATPVQGANYYRIKAEETTGKIVYSKILSVSLGKSGYGLRLYPNPVTGNQVTIGLSNMKRGQYNLRVVNATGQDVFRKMIVNQSNNLTQTLDLPSTIKPGVYNMVITADGYRETKMFIVQ